MNDEDYMGIALSLAVDGCGQVNPNPMVGAVIVKDGHIIGQGCHKHYGGLHAEREALAACTEPAEGAWLYVTLEPCCHQGKQPPCTDAILAAGIRRVVIGSPDPNPLVSGKGARILREHGVEVKEDVLRVECDALNEVFLHFIRTGLPFVMMKYAMTMDGKIAASSGASRWITGEASRRHVHQDRNRLSAIMTGVGTVLADDPLLTCRLPGGRNPIRIICDTHLRTPLTAQVVMTARAQQMDPAAKAGSVLQMDPAAKAGSALQMAPAAKAGSALQTDPAAKAGSALQMDPTAKAGTSALTAATILATCCTDQERHKPYLAAGCQILTVPAKDGHVDLRVLMECLGRRQIDSVLLEGGARLNWSALQDGIVRKVQAYVAPKLFGGDSSPSPIGGAGVAEPDEAFRLSPPSVTMLGEDILLESEVLPCLQES